MKYKLDLDNLIEQAVYDAFCVYTISGYNLDRVANLAAEDLIKNWGPELAEIIKPAILARMEESWKKTFGSFSTTTED